MRACDTNKSALHMQQTGSVKWLRCLWGTPKRGVSQTIPPACPLQQATTWHWDWSQALYASHLGNKHQLPLQTLDLLVSPSKLFLGTFLETLQALYLTLQVQQLLVFDLKPACISAVGGERREEDGKERRGWERKIEGRERGEEERGRS